MPKGTGAGELNERTIKLIAATIGYTLFILSNSFTLREPATFYPQAGLFSEMLLRAFTYLPFALVTLGLGVALARSEKTLDNLDRGTIALCGLGMALLLISQFLPPSRPFAVGLMLVFSAFTAVFFISWVSVSMSLPRNDLWLFLIISSMASSLGAVSLPMLDRFLPHPVLFAMLALASLGLLLFCRHLTHSPEVPPQPQPALAPGRILITNGPVILSVAALGFVASLARIIFEVTDVTYALQAEIAAVVIAGCVLLILVFMAKVPINPISVVLGAIPVVCIMCFLVPISGPSFHLAFLSIATTCFTVGLLLLQIVSKSFAEQDVARSTCCYCFISGVICLLSSTGYFVPLARLSHLSGLPSYAIAAILCLGILVLSLSLERLISERSTLQRREAVRTSDQAVHTLAERYRLTAREEEVLALMASGRDIPTIATTLFLSQNTVRTHSKHIFKKMDVHTRQKCLDMVEEEASRL